MSTFFGYIRIKKASGIDQAVKDEVKAIENGGNAQEFKIIFTPSLDNKENLVKLCLPFQGQALTDALEALSVDEYEVYGKKTYPDEDMKKEFKNSSTIALTYLEDKRSEYENPIETQE